MITNFFLLKISLLLGSFGIAIAFFLSRKKRYSRIRTIIPLIIAFYAAGQILLVLYFFINHINYPLNLEGLELIRLQHVRRALQGLPIFIEPTPAYIPLVYQPVYYYLTIPFVRLFGDNLASLRLVSILGSIGTSIILFLVVRDHSKSTWWGLIAVGIFAAAYQAMDSYYDIASADILLIFTILLGSYLISKENSRVLQCLGLIFLVVSFWIKQHGAIFGISALIYMTWRNNLRKALPQWILAFILGPLAYFLAGPTLFGPKFLFFTLEVPRQWIEFSWESSIVRVLVVIAENYPLLTIIGVALVAVYFLQQRHKIDIWYFLLPVALFMGFLASYFDPEGNDNIFIPMGVWIILTGVNSISDILVQFPRAEQAGLHILTVCLSFYMLFYNPRSEIIPPQAESQYQELIRFLPTLNGNVYAPFIGPLQDGYEFSPIANWITMIDLVRGPGVFPKNIERVNKLLAPVKNPIGDAYILSDRRLEEDPILSSLTPDYTLETDFETQYYALQGLPMRFMMPPPRFLYKYSRNENR